MISNFKNIRWHRVNSVIAASGAVPPLPGVYAYAEANYFSGLPHYLSWVYIGRARNLSYRLSQHESLNERNIDLRLWLSSVKDKGELWYASVDFALTIKLEIALISEFQPKFNKILYRNGYRNEHTTSSLLY